MASLNYQYIHVYVYGRYSDRILSHVDIGKPLFHRENDEMKITQDNYLKLGDESYMIPYELNYMGLVVHSSDVYQENCEEHIKPFVNIYNMYGEKYNDIIRAAIIKAHNKHIENYEYVRLRYVRNNNDKNTFLNKSNEYMKDINQFIKNKDFDLLDIKIRRYRYLINKILLEEASKCSIFCPSNKFMYAAGSKEYSLLQEFQSKMLPGTLIYPKDIDKIISLTSKGNYMVKAGLTSSSKGVEKLENADGFDILSHIFKQYNCNSIYIIQPYSDIFARCGEIRLFVTKDKIIGFFTNDLFAKEENRWDIVKLIRENKLEVGNRYKINPKITDFVENIIEDLNKNYPYYMWARIDIVVECKNCSRDSFFLKGYDCGNVYLNEIEPLGSGYHINMFDVINNYIIIRSIDSVSYYEKPSYGMSKIHKIVGKNINELQLHYNKIIAKIENKNNKHNKYTRQQIYKSLYQTSKEYNMELAIILDRYFSD